MLVFFFFIEKQNEQEWCKVAYWELSQRVGRLFPVDTKSVNVFWNVPLGTGLSLATLTQHHVSPSQSPPESVLRNRTKIGQGKFFKKCIGLYRPTMGGLANVRDGRNILFFFLENLMKINLNARLWVSEKVARRVIFFDSHVRRVEKQGQYPGT